MIYLIKVLVIILILFNFSYSQQYADSVVYAILGGPNNTHTNLNAVLGIPDFPSTGIDKRLSLGGGFIILDMGVYIVNGDGPDLAIYEVGPSYLPAGSNDPFYVLGNDSNSVTGWVYLGNYSGDICYVEFDSVNATSVRYIAIFDDNSRAATFHPWVTPGADIDAVEALNYQATKVSEKFENKNVTNFHLFQNYPNPFNPKTKIQYEIKNKSDVNLKIYNSLGQIVKTIIKENQEPGTYSIVWDGTNDNDELMPSGQYFYQLVQGDNIETKKALLLK